MMKRTIQILIISIPLALFGQDKSQSVMVADSLSYMLGEWRGSGWIMQGSNEKHQFSIHEKLEAGVDSSIIIVEGKGYSSDDSGDSTLTHDAFGVIYFDQDSGNFRMLSFTTRGGKIDTEFEVLDNRRARWSFNDERGGTVRFTENYPGDGQWSESGEYSHDGESWFQFMEMKLVKNQE